MALISTLSHGSLVMVYNYYTFIGNLSCDLHRFLYQEYMHNYVNFSHA